MSPALYAFTDNDTTRHRLTHENSSGAPDVGLPASRLRVPEPPFGGVAESGLGRCHGVHSFRTSSHHEGTLDVRLT